MLRLRYPLTWAALAVTTLAAPAAAHSVHDTFGQPTFKEAPHIIDCTLENGAAAKCQEFTVAYQPEGLEIGPFCPATLDDTGGLWDWDGKNAGLYRLDRAFFEMLADLGYRFYDADGTVNVVDIRTEQPDADHACVSASPDESVTITMRLPIAPVMADAPADLGTVAKVGVALDGVPIFADAPSVLDRDHLPALDVCGGHIDPGGWYHWHATATDLETVFKTEGVTADCALAQDAAALFGYAFDGFAIFGSREADGAQPTGLDQCGGHVGATAAGEIYHYHASESFPNLPTCLVGVTAKDNFTTTAAQGIGAVNPRGDAGTGGVPPGFDEAAATLGVTPEALLQAMDAAGGPQADLAAVAATLGVDTDALRAALPTPPNQ